MERRTKVILLAAGSVVLFGLVVWFIVRPLVTPALPGSPVIQPPSKENTPPILNPSGTPSANATGTFGTPKLTYDAYQANPDIALINEMKRRAGILAERAESGAASDGFTNYDDALLGGTSALATALNAAKAAARTAHPAKGPEYFTIATRLVEIPEKENRIVGNKFTVRVQLQVEVHAAGKTSIEYREAMVPFRLSGSQWLPEGYSVKALETP